MQLDCPNPKCGKKADRLIASSKGLGCNHCQEPESRGMDAIIGRVRFTNKGDVRRMTEADAMRIKTNKLRPDGTYKPDPRWR